MRVLRFTIWTGASGQELSAIDRRGGIKSTQNSVDMITFVKFLSSYPVNKQSTGTRHMLSSYYRFNIIAQSLKLRLLFALRKDVCYLENINEQESINIVISVQWIMLTHAFICTRGWLQSTRAHCSQVWSWHAARALPNYKEVWTHVTLLPPEDFYTLYCTQMFRLLRLCAFFLAKQIH